MWSADVELRPEAVALAKRLHRASPKTGKRISLRKIAAALAEARGWSFEVEVRPFLEPW